MVSHIDIIRTIIVSFIITLILGPIIIPLLRKLKIGQSIRDDGPQTHLIKSGTPTMGGIIMLIAVLIVCLSSGILNRDLFVLLFSTFGFGLIGFIDDYFKVANRQSLGLRAYQKLIGQVILAIILAIYQSKTSSLGTQVIVPFMKDTYLDLGILYIPLLVFAVVGTVNSVNLTDGLDGLASGVTLIIFSFFGLVAMNWGYTTIAIFAGAFTGACLGFLMYNSYPAKVFMGDTGSLALGGAVVGIAILMNLPLIIPIVGGVYFVEALSVMLQVGYYKLTKKRIFLMSPLHHHFEQKGWAETKVVIVFWAATVILALIGVLSLS